MLERLRTGDASAFEDFVSAYQHRVFAVAYRMLGNYAEAEEAAQEVFLRVYRSIGEFRGEAQLSTWLYTITSRLCLNRLASSERRMVRAREDDAILANVPGPGADAALELERREQRAALEQAISELPDERRLIVILRDVQGLSYEEIATALDLSLGTVRSRLHRGRLELKEKLEKVLS